MERLLFLFTTGLFFSTILFSQELVTDRPDQTESAVVVPKGGFQLEAGLAFRESMLTDEIRLNQFEMPTTLLG